MKKKILITLLLSAVLLLLFRGSIIRLVGRISPLMANDTLTQEEAEQYIVQICRTYRSSLRLKTRLITSQEKGPIPTDQEMIEAMAEDEVYISIGGGSDFYGDMEPLEVYGLFDCHFFLMDREVSINIAALSWKYSSGGIDNTWFQRTTIWTQAFLELVERTDIDGLSRRKAAKVLGDKWMEETGYVKEK